MKNNLLTEIKHIKSLMGINEDTNDECEEKLENDGYVVYNPKEQKGSVTACAGKKKIKCVKKWMDDNGVSEDDMEIGSFKNVCYLITRSNDKITMEGEELVNQTWIFWENGDLSHINTFSEKQIPDAAKPNEIFGQYRYQGKFVCDGTDLKSENMRYIGVYNVSDYTKLIKGKNIEIKLSDGTKAMVNTLLKTNDTLNKTKLGL